MNFLCAKKFTYASILLGTGVSVFLLGVFKLIPTEVLAIPFLDNDYKSNSLSSFFNSNNSSSSNVNIINNISYLLLTNNIGQIFDAIRIISSGSLQGMYKNTLFSMISGATMLIVGVPIGCVLGITNLGVIGINIGRNIGIFLGSILSFGYWYNKLKTLFISTNIQQVIETDNLSQINVEEEDHSTKEATVSKIKTDESSRLLLFGNYPTKRLVEDGKDSKYLQKKNNNTWKYKCSIL
jgi:hypothetical protein